MTLLARQFSRFVVVGGIATAFHYALLVLLVEAGSVRPVAASAAGALLGAIVSYFLNRTLTFRSQSSHRKAVPRFFTIALFAMVANAGLMIFFTLVLNLPYLPAQIITTLMIIVLTFTANRLWTFGDTGHT